jgi:hypothetical protein
MVSDFASVFTYKLLGLIANLGSECNGRKHPGQPDSGGMLFLAQRRPLPDGSKGKHSEWHGGQYMQVII